MKIAITGGTGFVGRHLAQSLISFGHEPVLLAGGRDRRHSPAATVTVTDLSDPDSLARAPSGCAAIAHCAGINREIGAQTYRRVHVEGTRNLIAAARAAAVPRIPMLSFLRPMRPVPVDDVTRIVVAALTAGRLSRQTVFVLGPETLLLSEAVRRVAAALHRRVWILPAPVLFHRILAALFERTMMIPLVARAQVRMLAEGFLDAAPAADALPDDLTPQRRFTAGQIRQGLPEPGPFTCADLRCRTT
jgi:NADH dehydrogenase